MKGRSLRIGLLALAGAAALLAPTVARATDPPIEYRAVGTWQSSASGAKPGTWKAILFKSAAGDALGGTISIDGAAAISDATVQGSMTDSSISFGVVQGDTTWATFTGAASGSGMSGTYTFSAFNDTGTWSGTLTQVPSQTSGTVSDITASQ